MTKPSANVVYAGFWKRLVATAIDSLALTLLLAPALGFFMSFSAEASFLIQASLAMTVTVAFWLWRGATPGKEALRMTIVDAETFRAPSARQLLIRYFGYCLSILGLGFGILRILWHPRRQGWHDVLANTVVIHSRSRE